VNAAALAVKVGASAGRIRPSSPATRPATCSTVPKLYQTCSLSAQFAVATETATSQATSLLAPRA